MSSERIDVWADLQYALDELGVLSREDIRERLKNTINLDVQVEGLSFDKLVRTYPFESAYSKAESRAGARNAHEAIEKGLKAILLDSGMSEKQVRRRGHKLHELLADVQQYNPVAFDALERCYDSAVQHIAFVRPYMSIIDYFEEYGSADVFNVNRYVSIEGGDNKYGMIVNVYREIMRALLSLVLGGTPKDINSRIEEYASEAILIESKFNPEWDAAKWLSQGPVQPRLKIIENINNNSVLLRAIRRCARESEDSGIRYWAGMRRNDIISDKLKERNRRLDREEPHNMARWWPRWPSLRSNR